ncbi:hypothetical protein [Enhygromyxa salina]|uniref:hypothetical protein n=1 Tax=Enhygromyxa salina TaxID=215803 RepID=UPI000D0970F1|nr:hypothetical protein [Enhygromyxa salina]
MLGAAAMMAASLVSPEAVAAEPLGTTLLGAPRMSWRMPPPLNLQPERARLVLNLPPEWMPAPDFGILGVPLDPSIDWEFRRAQRMTRATIGTSVRLQISDPAHSIHFGLRLMPRAAIAVLRFDPTARLH